MSTRTTHSLTFALGVGIGLLATLFTSSDGCVRLPSVLPPDTVFVRVPIVIPSTPEVKYRTLKEISSKVDTLVLEREISRLDSFLRVDTVERIIPVNVYSDSVSQDGVRLDYTIETVGFLLRFEPVISYKPVSCVVRPWTVGMGVSNQLNWKASLGRSGWLVEAEFGQSGFNEIYLTKQFNF